MSITSLLPVDRVQITRDDILNRDLAVTQTRDRCTVMAGTLDDPYTATVITFTKANATAVQIDHVIPLSYAWQMGAAAWTEETREQFANDPLNLVAVDGPANAAKSDSGPASWLPPSKPIRCAYAARFAQVAIKYSLPVTAPDKATMSGQCA